MSVSSKNHKIRVGFAAAALLVFAVCQIWFLCKEGACGAYNTYGFKHDLISKTAQAVPFICLFIFTYIEDKLSYVNKRIYPISVFGLFVAEFILFYCISGIHTDSLLYKYGYFEFGTGGLFIIIAAVCRLVCLILSICFKGTAVKLYSLGMIVLYIMSFIRPDILHAFGDYVYYFGGLCLAYILFNIALFFYGDIITESDALFGIGSLFKRIEDMFCSESDYEYDFGDDDAEYDEEENEPFIYEDHTNIREILWKTYNRTVNDTALSYNAILVCALRDREEDVLYCHEVLSSLASGRFHNEKGVLFTAAALNCCMNNMYEYAKKLKEKKEELVSDSFIYVMEDLLSEKKVSDTLIEATSFAKTVIGPADEKWDAACELVYLED